MAIKKSVFLSDSASNWIDSTTSKHFNGKGPKWSESINATFDQLRFLLRESIPELETREWKIILNVYEWCYFPAHISPPRISSDIMNNVGVISIDKLSDDYAALVTKIHEMSKLEQIAILYFVQIFWANEWKSDWDEIVKSIKSKF